MSSQERVRSASKPLRRRSVPAVAPDVPPSADQVELLGLSVMVTVLERMTPAERRRALVYLTDRYGGVRS